LNLKVEVTDFAFEGLGGAIANGQADVAIGAISKTPSGLNWSISATSTMPVPMVSWRGLISSLKRRR